MTPETVPWVRTGEVSFVADAQTGGDELGVCVEVAGHATDYEGSFAGEAGRVTPRRYQCGEAKQ